MAAFTIEYDELALEDLERLRRVDQVMILDKIERHLSDQPMRESRRSIKKLDPPVLASYRLQAGDYRVFYDVDAQEMKVRIVAIRYKGSKTLDEAAHGSRN